MKKQIALLLAIMMLVGVMGTVPAFATTAEWTPTSSDDGYTKQLADYDMTETVATPGIMGAKLIKDEGFDGTAIDTTQLGTDANGTYSIVSATAETVKDADAHGKVLKQVGQDKTEYATSKVKKTNLWTADGVVNNAKKVVAQVDVNVETRPPSTGQIDVLKVAYDLGEAQTIRFTNKPTNGKSYIQVCKDGTTKTCENIIEYSVGQWYTIAIELDFTGETNKLSVWIGGEKVADNVLPYGNLSTAEYIKSIGFEMNWGATASTNKPAVYYDNFQVWTDMGVTEDLTTTDASYGKAVKLTSEEYTEYAVLNPSLTDSEFTLSAPDEDKAIEFTQAKEEVDVKLTVDNSDAGVGVYYVDNSGNGKYVELVDLSGYAAGWHNVVMYVDAVSKKYTAYVDGVIKHDNEDISDNGIVAPRSLFVSCKATTIYADNIKYSVPEFYDPFGNGLGEVTGVQKITDYGFESLSIVTDSGKASITNSSGTKEIESDAKGTYSIVSASEEALNGALTYGKVLKQVGASGAVEEGSTSIANTTAYLAKPKKAIVQANVYVATKPSDYIGFDVFCTYPNGTSTTDASVPTIRFNRDNGDIVAYMTDAEGNLVSEKVGTYYTKKWYAVTVEVDTENDKYSAWINGKQVVDNATPYGNLAEATQIKQMQLRMAWKKGTVQTAPVVYYDNYKVYVADDSGNLAVTGIEGSEFVETRQGENKYSLAYVLDGETSSEGTLIAAVYNASNALARIAFDNTDTNLASTDKKLLLTNFEKTAGETLKKMLWQSFSTIKPLIPAE